MLYTEKMNWQIWFIHEPQGVKRLRAFESQPNSVAATLGIMKQEHLSRPITELVEQEKAVGIRPNSETTLSLLMKKKDAVFAEDHFGSTIVVALTSTFNDPGV